MERQLVEAAQRGDERAFVELAGARVDRLVAVAQRMLRDVDRAEDAVQDALVVAWRDLPRLRDPDRLDAWLYRLLVRACIDLATRERRIAGRMRPVAAEEAAARDEIPSIADRDELERGFRRLPPDQRAILVLRHFLGYEPAEIADVLGIPAGTARSRLHHAHRAMRAALDADARRTAREGRLA